eukprot:3384872-Lingulodinium_polyedra.AAC.1
MGPRFGERCPGRASLSCWSGGLTTDCTRYGRNSRCSVFGQGGPRPQKSDDAAATDPHQEIGPRPVRASG